MQSRTPALLEALFPCVPPAGTELLGGPVRGCLPSLLALLALVFHKHLAACSPGRPTLLPIHAFQRLPSAWCVLSPNLRT